MSVIPAGIHPNHITATNAVFNMVLYMFAMYAGYRIHNGVHVSMNNDRLYVILLCCGAMTYMGMVLDCLDGMVARARKQTSKTGEFLDHWCDAINTPLITSGISFVLRFTGMESALVIISISGLYCAQLLTQNIRKDFVAVAGVEGQLLTTICYIIACFTVNLPESHYLVYYVAKLMFAVGFCASVIPIFFFVKDFRWREMAYLALFLYTQAMISYLYIDMSYLAYSWLACVNALSMNGQIVFLNVITNQVPRQLVTSSALYAALCMSILCCIQTYAKSDLQHESIGALKPYVYGIMLIMYSMNASETLLQVVRYFNNNKRRVQ